MAQLDVYANPVARQRRERPYLLEVQADLLGAMVTTVVVPLVDAAALPMGFDRLTPLFEIDGVQVRCSVTEIFSLPRIALGPALFNLHSERQKVIAALDHLISGF